MPAVWTPWGGTGGARLFAGWSEGMTGCENDDTSMVLQEVAAAFVCCFFFFLFQAPGKH